MIKKKLALFFDGTWNTPISNTRVHAAHSITSDNAHQKTVYFKGLGTNDGQAFTGGVFAKGLGENVCAGYQWLVDNYNDGDKVFIFGFSRGSFTATSVCAMIMRFGLIRQNSPFTTNTIFDRFEKWSEHTTLFSLQFRKNFKGETDFTPEEQALLDHSRRIDIEFIGLWDSVATIGFPIGNISGFSRNALKFHNPRPSVKHKNVYHALAIDEHRKGFKSILFHDYIDSDDTVEEVEDDRAELATRFEQRWFCGSHGDVGGGDNASLANAPYRWVMQKAVDLGLELSGPLPEPTPDLTRIKLNDSYRSFLKGIYKFLRFGRRHYRKIGARATQKREDRIETIHETIDASVFERWKQDTSYRPKNLSRLFKSEIRIKSQIGDYTITQGDRH